MIKNKEKIKVLVGSTPFIGHYIPMIRIAEALNKCSEFEVAFATSEFAFQKISLSTQIKKLKLKDEFQGVLKQYKFEQLPCYYYDKQWNQQISEIIQDFKPQIILTDFIAFSIIKIGKKCGIPTIVHLPSPVTFCIPFMHFPSIKNTISVLGITMNYNNIRSVIMPKKFKLFYDFGKQLTSSVVIVSSFYGIQNAISLPPNFKMVGLTFERNQSQPKIESDLKQWIQKMKKNNKNIIYVSFGTIAQFSSKFINFLYEGLRKMNIAVIWSLRQGDIPDQSPNFYIKRWLPQQEILKLKEIKLMITHCGWGAISECIQGTKPMLCIPHCGDQVENAKLTVDKGIGLILRKKNDGRPQIVDQFKFTHEELDQKINILINDQSYLKRLKNLKNIMMAETGGCEQVVKIVRNAANFGINHLIDRDVERIQKTTLMPLFFVVVISIVLFLFWSAFGSKDSIQTL